MTCGMPKAYGPRARRKPEMAQVRPNQSATSSSSSVNMGMPDGEEGPKTRLGAVQKAVRWNFFYA